MVLSDRITLIGNQGNSKVLKMDNYLIGKPGASECIRLYATGKRWQKYIKNQHRRQLETGKVDYVNLRPILKGEIYLLNVIQQLVTTGTFQR